MQDPGALKIELGVSGGYVCVAAIRSRPPHGASRLFEGRLPEEAPTLARRLYSLCSRAQGAASVAAVEAALGRRPSPDARRAEAAGVLAERVFESLRAMVFGWPSAATFARRASAPLREAAAAAEAIARGDASLARLADIRAALDELENMISRKDPSVEAVIVAGRTAAGSGFSAVECARGRLYHLAQVNGNGRLQVYAHVAPTEWNFHHAGPLAAQLLGARLGRAEAAQIAGERLVALVDPCVAAEVTVREAN